MSAAKKTEDTSFKVIKVSEIFNLQFLDQQNLIELKSNICFDFESCTFVDKNVYPLLYKIKTNLQKNGFNFSSINIDEKLMYKIQEAGTFNIFNFERKVPPVERKIDVVFITPFINSTIVALKTQTQLDVVCKSPVLKTNQNIQVDIAGVISIVSDAFRGTISLCFPKATFLKICTSLLGEVHEEVNPEIEDLAGELLNMIFGAAKAELNDKNGYAIQRALPTIISGNNLKLRQSQGPTLLIPFESSLGTFHLEIEVVENK